MECIILTREARHETQDVKLVVYDALGRQVAILVNEILSAGSYEIDFNGSNFSSGIYFYKLNADNFFGSEENDITKVKIKDVT